MNDSLPAPEEAWAFAQSQLKICPKCGESNPSEAVMCWACYRPLPAAGVDVAEHRREVRKVRRQIERRARLEIHLHQTFETFPVVGVGLLIASGYARKHRVAVGVSGLLALAANFVWSQRKEVLRARLQAEEGKPIERITDTLLLYAVRDGATQIRLRAGLDIHVHYLISDEWVEQMRIPSYIWKDLCAHLIEGSDNWKRPVPFGMDEKRFEFSPEFVRERELPLETLTLSLLD